MSHKRQQKSPRQHQLSPEVLKYCPNYAEYDKRARKESKDRINQHLSGRKNELKKCVDAAIADIVKLDVKISRKAVIFNDDDSILLNAAHQTNIQIKKWDGVQIKQCKKEDDDGQIILIDSWQKFAKKAKNHQDQTSWKISGDYFFAPYIEKARTFLYSYCKYIDDDDIDDKIKKEIVDLSCLSFANALFYGEIKFHRTKPKPLIRHRTLVKSNGIHIELEKLHKSLSIRRFIQNAKLKRKNLCNKSNIIAGDFFIELKAFTNYQYLQQKRKVYNLLHLKFNDIIKSINNDNIFGDLDELKYSDIDDDDHSNDNDDDDDIDHIMNDEDNTDNSSDSPSSTPSINGSFMSQSDGYKGYKIQNKKIKNKTREFQAISINNINKENNKNNKIKKKIIRKKQINRNCKDIQRNYNCHSHSNSIGYVTDINAVNIHENNNNNNNKNEYRDCRDCRDYNTSSSLLLFNDDHTTISSISTATPISSTPNMSPIRLSSHHRNNYNNNHYDEQQSISQCGIIINNTLNEVEKANQLQQENEKLRKEIQEMRFLMNQSMAHHHAPIIPHIHHHHHNNNNIHHQYQQYPSYPPPQYQHNNNNHNNNNNNNNIQHNLPDLPPIIDQSETVIVDNNNNNNNNNNNIMNDNDNDDEEELLFPDGTMIINHNNNNNINSVDPFNIINNTSFNQSMFIPNLPISPEPTMHLNSQFY